MDDTSRWIKLAMEDKEMAELAYSARLYNQACFHSQQGAEKCLKAHLLEKDGKFPKTHSLTELLMLASLKERWKPSQRKGRMPVSGPVLYTNPLSRRTVGRSP